jgi:thiol-disulfide isomerase/thioredoxin
LAKDIPNVTDGNFEEEVLKSGLPVLIDFWAAWCVPCRMIAPTVEQIAESHGEKLKVVKMNVDTDCQYTFTRPIVDHMMKNYDGVLMIDGEMGSKKAYDPRSYLALGEGAMAERVKRAARELKSVGTTFYRA